MAGAPPEGALPSPNIWGTPETYEVENRAVDPDRVIESAMRTQLDWAGRDVLDLGCGTGFHLPRFAADATSVIGLEPHPDLAAIARRRVRRLSHIEVVEGVAQSLPLADSSVDLVHARWAYFFGPGCEPGLLELQRVVRPGGVGFVIDNDTSRSTFGTWFRRGYPKHDAAEVERFWHQQGWSSRSLDMEWSFQSRADLEAVVRIEFGAETAEWILDNHTGTRVDYAIWLRSKSY